MIWLHLIRVGLGFAKALAQFARDRAIRQNTRKATLAEYVQESMDEVRTAKEARDNLHDPNIRGMLRKRFTRKDK